MDDQDTINQMLDAFTKTFVEQGGQMTPDLTEHARDEMAVLVERVAKIQTMLANKEIDDDDAKNLLAMQAKTVTEHLLTLSGAAKVLLQNSMNSAMTILKAVFEDILSNSAKAVSRG